MNEIEAGMSKPHLPSPYPRKTGLSPRELEIVNGLVLGKTRQQVALGLGISTNTLKSHLARVYRYLGAANAAEAVAKLRENQPEVLVQAAKYGQPAPQLTCVSVQDGQLKVTFELVLRLWLDPLEGKQGKK
ncbi:MAG TPA: helix-turn-helix transcriptional regulator [Anaerolineales bacterium]|jgi:DNA-binding CsgD family transcriptional regulator